MISPRKCKDCDKPVSARKMCKNHYDKWLKLNNESYRQRQRENCTKWIEANKERTQNYGKTRRLKLKQLPNFKEFERSRYLRSTYGMTVEHYNEVLVEQNYMCKLCFKAPASNKRLHVDHCHETGKLRGLLCNQCNWYLGKIDKDPDLIDRIKDYRENASIERKKATND